jgi:hypothetical protein
MPRLSCGSLKNAIKETEWKHTVARFYHKNATRVICLYPLHMAASRSSSMTLAVMILVGVIVVILILLYLLHWYHQKRKVHQGDVTSNRNNSSRRLAEGGST